MPEQKLKIKNFLPLFILLLLLLLAAYFRIDRYLSYASLQSHYQLLRHWADNHFFSLLAAFGGVYILAVAISIPGAVFLSLASGLLFGLFWGTLVVVISATIGATILFYAVRTSLGTWLAPQAKGWLSKMRDGFLRDAFSYLLILRLIPIFPFWAVNIVPALLNISAATFISATFLGIIPGSIVYIAIGNGLNHVIEQQQQPDLSIIFSWPVLLPLLGLAGLTVLGIIYKNKLKK